MAVTFETVERKRREFARALREFRKTGTRRYHNPAPELPAEALKGCEVLPNRGALLDRVPHSGVLGHIGVGQGNLSLEILHRCHPLMLHLFTPDAAAVTNLEVKAELAAETSRMKTQVGDPLANLARMPDGYFDMVYVDGEHDYPLVRKTIEVLAPKMRPNGAIVFAAYAVWSASSMYHCGVARAVNEFCIDQGWGFRYLALQEMMYNEVMVTRR